MRGAFVCPAVDGPGRLATGVQSIPSVIVDDLASQILVLDLRAAEHDLVASWLADAANQGVPFRLTLHRLGPDPVTPVADDDYRAALETGDSEVLKGPVASSSWEPRLADEMKRRQRAMMEDGSSTAARSGSWRGVDARLHRGLG